MLKMARKLIILVIGLTVVLIGVIMLVTPGPAIVVIPVGLAILGTEFLWARRILKKMKEEGEKVGSSVWKSIFGKAKQTRQKDAN
jgi:uncharacterized protein (TIGR02611 family)